MKKAESMNKIPDTPFEAGGINQPHMAIKKAHIASGGNRPVEE